MNKSGIYPSGNRVLIKPDELEEQISEGGIVLPSTVKERHQLAQTTGTLVEAGPDAFQHITERRYSVGEDGRQHLVEIVSKGYSEPFAAVGDRIAYARYSGQTFRGEDGKNYLLTNDEDITGRVSENVELSEFKSRQGTGPNSGLAA